MKDNHLTLVEYCKSHPDKPTIKVDPSPDYRVVFNTISSNVTKERRYMG